MRTHDCEPTLTDSQVLDFCKTGYLPLEGVVPDDVNQRVVEFMDEHAPHIEPGDFANHEPNEILDQDWFIDGVLCNPVAAGAVRCLLGRDFALPGSCRATACTCRPAPTAGIATAARCRATS